MQLMNILIIEDEYPAAERLQRLLQELPESTEVVEVLDSVESAIKWFDQNPAPDLILSDIQLSDGLSFEIYENTLVKAPIVFTTSYDEYAIKAFKVKSIDYLLKPVKLSELSQAIQKYTQWKQEFSETDHIYKLEQLLDNLQHTGRQHKKRFLVKKGEQLLPLNEDEIAYFYTENELVFLYTYEGRKYVLDYTLEQLEQMLSPAKFFRINRQYILHLEAIEQIHNYFSSRYKLQIRPVPPGEIIVSKGKAKSFRMWLES
ncbi:LytR/AlgR family response regulator transcription factor [Catalinimonas niigatensis]|uniref:LytR/AlgR family response regulator transcription factor n=1 Tax=Catalinimonas niigatensis TaxID=1397264 RepID=UPI0026669FC6|nr:LytTR family DNA-binding domain-containing protein [Catalinimonas niigatensis]WPP53353.1 LytTR family DNA-binding domain-containing protein [Catalinimonas niigatensis]